MVDMTRGVEKANPYEPPNATDVPTGRSGLSRIWFWARNTGLFIATAIIVSLVALTVIGAVAAAYYSRFD